MTQIRDDQPQNGECCGKCALSREPEVKENRIGMKGWLNCDKMKSYEYHAPRAVCFFSPSCYISKVD